MGIAEVCRAREPHSINERGVIQFIGNDAILASDQPTEDSEIGQIAGGEDQCAGAPGGCGEVVAQGFMRFAVTGKQCGSTATHSVAAGTFGKRLDEAGMVGEAQVIVAAEIEQRLFTDAYQRPLWTPIGFQRSPTLLVRDKIQLTLETREVHTLLPVGLTCG